MLYARQTASKHAALIALSASLVVLPQTGPAVSMPAADQNAAGCQIRASLMPNGLRLEALADPQEAIAGEYRLSVAKDSASGSSRNLQSGAFQVEAGKQQILATIILDRSAVGHYSATLSLQWENGHESCSSP
jgi:hypothetical protein